MISLFRTEEYGHRVYARPDYRRPGFFFEDPQPELDRLLKADCLALESWQRYPTEELPRLPASMWSYATLDDLFDAEAPGNFLWQLSSLFPLEAFHDFMARWQPWLDQALGEALRQHDPAERLRDLDVLRERASLILHISERSDGALARSREALAASLDRLRLADLCDAPFDATAWISVIKAMKSHAVQSEALSEWAQRVAAAGGDLLLQLEKVAAAESLRDRVAYDPEFWAPFEPHLTLEPTLVGERIAIATATEVRPTLGWELLRARRVGTVVPGRMALLLQEGSQLTYIAGERKLKHQVMRAGGTLERMGNTLVMEEGDEAQLERRLIEVERLMTLAQVDPAQAVAALGDAPLTTPIATVAERAESDPRYRHILADLLIEEVTGLDADIARAQVRDRSRGNRR